ncbi:ATP-dependent Lon protease pim1 [Rhizophlyctis rosea]|nr:ATP-dependent Lon protease pim1 [Rhizophlyctis rosea]
MFGGMKRPYATVQNNLLETSSSSFLFDARKGDGSNDSLPPAGGDGGAAGGVGGGNGDGSGSGGSGRRRGRGLIRDRGNDKEGQEEKEDAVDAAEEPAKEASASDGKPNDGGDGAGAPASAGSGSSNGGRGRNGKGTGRAPAPVEPLEKAIAHFESGGDPQQPSPNALERVQIPDEYPQLLAIPLNRRPLFPGFYKSLYIKDPQAIAAIQNLIERRQPYVGIFLTKDDNSEADVVTDLDQIHRVGVFAQITNTYPAGPNNKALTLVVYPYRRIKINDLVKPPKLVGGVPAVHTDEVADTTPVEAKEEGKEESKEELKPEVEEPKAEVEVPEPPAPVETTTKVEEITEDQKAPSESISESSAVPDIIEPTSPSPAAEPEQPLEPTPEGYDPVNAPLSHFAVSLVNVTNMMEEPYNHTNAVIKATTSEMLNVLREISTINPLLRDQIITFSIQTGGNAFADPAKLADFAAAVSAGEPRELQDVLESLVIEERLTKSLYVLKKELANAQLQQEIAKDVDKKITRKQQEFFLMEQLKGIKKELGMDSDGKEKLAEKFRERMAQLKMPEEVKKVVDEELNKLQHLEPAASEFNVTRNYLDWLTQIPWGLHSKENFNIKHAVKVLDEDHYGLKDVKDRILEFIAVGKLRGTVEGKIICLVGPPGVGKTSVGKSIARALGREFYRFSVGGLTDVAEIKGHRRTYVGAMPGKVVQALKKVQTENPLIMIDEIDKLGRGHQGDPASALLELLDPEQNSSFLDHYMDVPMDLSKVLFVCTANTLDTIPGPLLDRMETIQLSGYVAEEKVAIAERYLAPQARKAAGLDEDGVNVDVVLHKEAVEALIRSYCRESGVRNLKKHIDKVYRKAAFRIVEREEGVVESVGEEGKVDVGREGVETGVKVEVGEGVALGKEEGVKEEAKEEGEKEKEKVRGRIEITKDTLKEYVGSPVYVSDRMYDTTPPGVVMGLAWTAMGGSALYVESVLESAIKAGKDAESVSRPAFHRTGQLGDVMKESSTIAYTYAKSLMARQHPDNTFFERAAVHLHVPEGATPKDGPSAGVTMTTSLLSLALQKPVRPNTAMTGEITLTGKVLKVGGIKEKVIAAKRSGVDLVVLPKANEAEWEELPGYVKEGVEVKFAGVYEDVFRAVF